MTLEIGTQRLQAAAFRRVAAWWACCGLVAAVATVLGCGGRCIAARRGELLQPRLLSAANVSPLSELGIFLVRTNYEIAVALRPTGYSLPVRADFRAPHGVTGLLEDATGRWCSAVHIFPDLWITARHCFAALHAPAVRTADDTLHPVHRFLPHPDSTIDLTALRAETATTPHATLSTPPNGHFAAIALGHGGTAVDPMFGPCARAVVVSARLVGTRAISLSFRPGEPTPLCTGDSGGGVFVPSTTGAELLGVLTHAPDCEHHTSTPLAIGLAFDDAVREWLERTASGDFSALERDPTHVE